MPTGTVDLPAGSGADTSAGRGPRAIRWLRPGAARWSGAGRRQRLLGVMLGLAVLATTAGWFAGRSIESPEDAARKASAPPASVVTAKVERRTLTTAVVVRGDIGYSGSMDVSVDSDIGTGDLKGGGVVTGHVPAVGTQLTEGAVALEVSGRPIFLLRGDLPTYRAFTPGSTVPDVKQLEAALDRLGFHPGPVDGVYDGETQAASPAGTRRRGMHRSGRAPRTRPGC